MGTRSQGSSIAPASRQCAPGFRSEWSLRLQLNFRHRWYGKRPRWVTAVSIFRIYTILLGLVICIVAATGCSRATLPTVEPTVDSEQIDEAQVRRDITRLNGIISENPVDGPSLYERGMAHHSIGEYRLAAEDFGEAIRSGWDTALAYYGRGLAHLNLGRFDVAMRDFNKAIDLNPGYAQAFSERGRIYLSLGGGSGRVERALEDFNEAIRLDSQLAAAYGNRAIAYSQLDQPAATERDIRTAETLGLDIEPLRELISDLRGD